MLDQKALEGARGGRQRFAGQMGHIPLPDQRHALDIKHGQIAARQLLAHRAQRQEAQQEAMLMEKAQQELAVVGQAAGAAKDLSQAQLADPSALSGLMGMNGG